MLYTVKNINTNEISEQDIPQTFIEQLLELGQEYNGFIKASQEEVDSFNQSKLDTDLEMAKKTRKALVDAARDKWINETTINVPINGGFINLKIDLNTRNELTQINQGFIAGIIDVANFGDSVDKITKQISQETILNYFGLVDNALNGSEAGVYPRARLLKSQINECKSSAEIDAIVINFDNIS